MKILFLSVGVVMVTNMISQSNISNFLNNMKMNFITFSLLSLTNLPFGLSFFLVAKIC